MHDSKTNPKFKAAEARYQAVIANGENASAQR